LVVAGWFCLDQKSLSLRKLKVCMASEEACAVLSAL